MGFRAPVAPRLLAAALLLLTTGCVSIELFDGGAKAPLEESLLQGERGPKILLIDINGPIDDEAPFADQLFGVEPLGMVARMREVLDRAREDEEVQGLLLRIDSPGGTATASEQIYTEILRFKQERKVPVLAQLLSMATSGGYYIAMAADAVIAHPTAVTGSIGVVYSSVSFAGLMDKLGIENQTIKAGEYKDMGSPLGRLSSDERAQLQAIVDDLHLRFRTIVERGRPDLTPARVRELADGRIYSAPQAVENGLVDRLGTLHDSVRELERRMSVREARVVGYHRPREVRRNLYSRASGSPPRMESDPLTAWSGALTLERLEPILARPGFLYLWWPGLGN